MVSGKDKSSGEGVRRESLGTPKGILSHAACTKRGVFPMSHTRSSLGS